MLPWPSSLMASKLYCSSGSGMTGWPTVECDLAKLAAFSVFLPFLDLKYPRTFFISLPGQKAKAIAPYTGSSMCNSF